MLDAAINEENGERRYFGLDLLQVLGQLKKEAQFLNDEKTNLLEIEEKLWFMINEENESKRLENEELRIDVEELRRKCEELSRILNIYIREQ
jgi:polyhydroxyalkanoate synthesis regulator phasin